MQLVKNTTLFILIIFLSLYSMASSGKEPEKKNRVRAPAHAQKVKVHKDRLGKFIKTLDKKEAPALHSKEERHVEYISTKYRVSESDAKAIVNAAQSNADPVFPKYEDIMAVVEVESAFKRRAGNARCYGLMQLKYAYHKATIRRQEQLYDIETNIRIGAAYLKELHPQVGRNGSSAVSAYNTGFGSFLNGRRNKAYVNKVSKAKRNFLT